MKFFNRKRPVVSEPISEPVETNLYRIHHNEIEYRKYPHSSFPVYNPYQSAILRDRLKLTHWECFAVLEDRHPYREEDLYTLFIIVDKVINTYNTFNQCWYYVAKHNATGELFYFVSGKFPLYEDSNPKWTYLDPDYYYKTTSVGVI